MEKKKKGFFGEFKEFISRGNVVDMAVGVIVGGAFSAIVTALTANIFQPLINWALSAGGGEKALEAARTILKGVYDPDTGKIVWESSIYIDWGAFISALINFLLVAFILFSIVKIINSVRDNSKTFKDKALARHLKKHPEEVVIEPEPEPVPPEPTDHELLKEMLAVLKEQNKSKNN